MSFAFCPSRRQERVALCQPDGGDCLQAHAGHKEVVLKERQKDYRAKGNEASTAGMSRDRLGVRDRGQGDSWARDQAPE